MKYLKIKNKGLLDIRLISLMGGTTKKDNEFKIGQFGTGLKYAISYLIRENIMFNIFIDGKEVEISTKNENIANIDFNIIYINGKKTSITTNMGLEWEPWMIIRELWCNALDEKEGSFCITEEILPEKNTTEYYIQLTGDIKKVHEEWDKYFIHSKVPIQENEKFAIYSGGEKLRFYKNGVLVKETNDKSVFSYDIKNIEINELREFNGSLSYEIVKIFKYFDKKTAEIFLNNLKGTFEDKMDYNWYTTLFGEGWGKCLENTKIIDYETYAKIEDRLHLDKEAIVQVPKGLFDKMIDKYPSISLVRASSELGTFFETYSDMLNDKIKKSLAILESVGYFISPELKILTGVFGDKKTIAQVNFDDKEIRISQDMENMHDTEIIYALIEENEHFNTGFHDETREFQDHFIKLYANLLLKEKNIILA